MEITAGMSSLHTTVEKLVASYEIQWGCFNFGAGREQRSISSNISELSATTSTFCE